MARGRSGRRGDVDSLSLSWDTSLVTSMKDLFCADPAYPTNCDPARASFNDDISAWDTGRHGHARDVPLLLIV